MLDALGPAHVTATTGIGVAYAAYPDAEEASPRCRACARRSRRTTAAPWSWRRPPAVRDGLDHWGPVGDAFPLMQRVKERFDPERRLSPGRLLGGL